MNWNKHKQPDKASASGIIIKQNLITRQTSNLYICLLRGLIIFLAGIGTVGCYFTSFSISYYQLPVILTLLGASFLFSFFYYNRLILNVGYITFFVIYAPLLIHFKAYISSGYGAILNQTLDVIDPYYMLPARNQYVEHIADRTLSVTVFCCFVGIFYCMILNAVISGYMSILITFLASFPLVAVGLFFERKPESIWFSCVLLSWTMVYILKKSRLYKNRKKQERYYRYVKNRHIFAYPNEAKGLFQTCLFIAACAAALFVILLNIYPKRVFHTPEKWNSYKERMDEPVRNFIMMGFSSFFNEYDAAGGISGGKLGGISSVRPDFETDLLVQFTPYSNQTVYLPAYYANEYIPFENRWLLVFNPNNQKETPAAVNKEAALLKKTAKKDSDIFNGKMRITVTGADSKYAYHPYFSLFDSRTTTGLNLRYYDNYYARSSRQNTVTDFTYYQSADSSSYSGGNYGSYGDFELDVPEELQKTLKQICKEEGFGGTQEEIIQQIQTYLEKDFTYSLKPGLTPKKTDFVTYFLTRRKKGYCVYFASSATLLLRTMGIPARYVEGYAISYDKVLDSNEVEGEDYNKWFSGKSSLGKTTVVEVEVSDADAHAWTEYYKKDFGWIPLEVTTAQSEQDASSNAFWDFFSSAFQNDSKAVDKSETFTALNTRISKHSRQAGFYVILLLVLFVAGKFSLRKLFWFYHLKHFDKRIRVIATYQYIYQLLLLSYGESLKNRGHSFTANWLQHKFPTDEIDYTQWIALVKQASYSNRPLSDEELITCKTVFHKLKHMLWMQLHLRNKIRSLFLKAPKKLLE